MTVSSLVSTAIATLIGIIISTLVQWLARKHRDLQAAKALRADIGLIYRHIDASIASLRRTRASAPIYLFKARLRYCMFVQSPLSYTQLDFIERTGRAEKMRIMLTLMRNSDIFLEELAASMEKLSIAQRGKALEGAIVNMESLRDLMDKLELRSLASASAVSASLASSTETSSSASVELVEKKTIKG